MSHGSCGIYDSKHGACKAKGLYGNSHNSTHYTGLSSMSHCKFYRISNSTYNLDFNGLREVALNSPTRHCTATLASFPVLIIVLVNFILSSRHFIYLALDSLLCHWSYFLLPDVALNFHIVRFVRCIPFTSFISFSTLALNIVAYQSKPYFLHLFVCFIGFFYAH